MSIVGPLVLAQKLLKFRIERQEERDWCWAAVATSIDHYFDYRSNLKQCEVASKVVPTPPPSDPGCCCKCCCDPEKCDQPAELMKALRKIHEWRGTLKRALSFAEVQREIDNGRPIGVGIQWMSGGSGGTPQTTGHYVVVRGYRILSSGTCQVYVADPLNASGLVDFDEFTFAYYGEGKWVETNLVQRKWE